MKPALSFTNVDLAYRRTPVLHDVTFAVAAGESIGLLGPNGVGKSSMARLATGFLRPTSGTVSVAGSSPLDHRRRRGIGYAPEELPRGWNGRVRDLLRMRPASSNVLAEWQATIMEMLRVDALLDKPIPTLSKGQWRAVVIAYALSARSNLVVLDEPDSGLDPGALDRLAATLRHVRAAGITIVLLSHQLFEVDRVCDRVLFVSAGRIAAEERTGAGADHLRRLYTQVFS